MKTQYRKLIFSWGSVSLLCLLVPCTPATGVESGSDMETVDKSATAATPDEEQGSGKPQDIIDRMFSPLDNAVSDINRDLNKDDAEAPSTPNE